MTIALAPSPFAARFGSPVERFLVRDGDRLLGEVERRPNGDWTYRPAGWPYFVPTLWGLRMDAIARLVDLAGTPYAAARRDIPAILKIARVEDGAVVRPADGVEDPSDG